MEPHHETLAEKPIIYEINTWVWVEELRERLKVPVSLGSVPAREWDAIAALGVDAVWFMGVWERSPAHPTFSDLKGQGGHVILCPPGKGVDLRPAVPASAQVFVSSRRNGLLRNGPNRLRMIEFLESFHLLRD